MTLKDLQTHPGFMAAWPDVWPLLAKHLEARALIAARSAKCVIESAQAEMARQREIAMLIDELSTLSSKRPEPAPRTMMRALHSMTEPTEND